MTRHGVTILVSLSAALGACNMHVQDEVAEFRNGVPRRETITVQVPASRDQTVVGAHTVEQQQALRGDTAEFYQLTYNVTHLINGGALFVGLLVKAVIAHPPTTIADDTATWGPWSDALEPVAWKVTITKIGDHKFQYAFLGRPKHDPGADFVTVLAGTHTAAVDDGGNTLEGYGAGSFTLDWDARNTLPLPPRTVAGALKDTGKAHYTYSRPGAGAVASIDAQFRGVRDNDTGNTIDVDYLYTRQPAGSGTMDFTWAAPAWLGKPAGTWGVRSRWTSGGAGRSDVVAVNAEMPAGVKVTECWDERFASVFLSVPFAPAASYGVEADCAFTTAEYTTLPLK